MSWGTCYSGSNNIHFNFPPLMDDSRLFSNYYSSVLNDSVFQNNKNITNNSDYRKYLQVNADAIIQNNQYISCIESGTTPSNNNSQPLVTNQSPYIFNSILSRDQPYGYETSDLKNIYLSKQQLDAQKHVSKYVINANE
jgi:hypothetical protein